MSTQRFLVHRDNRVTASGFLLGRVYEHAPISVGYPRQSSKWFAVHPEGGIVNITNDRSRAALDVAKASGYEDATLLDIDFEEPRSEGSP